MFEKYDGIRGFWNLHTKKMYSRQGQVINIPPFILDTLPKDVFLDGELWYIQPSFFCKPFIEFFFIFSERFGRESEQEAAKLVRRLDLEGLDWSKFKYMVFDIPNHSGTYSERHAKLGKSPFLPILSRVLQRTPCLTNIVFLRRRL